jgi:hypothetical protein
MFRLYELQLGISCLLPPFPAGLPEDISERTEREVLFGMRNSDLAGLFWVFKLVMISFGMMENPPVLL